VPIRVGAEKVVGGVNVKFYFSVHFVKNEYLFNSPFSLLVKFLFCFVCENVKRFSLGLGWVAFLHKKKMAQLLEWPNSDRVRGIALKELVQKDYKLAIDKVIEFLEFYESSYFTSLCLQCGAEIVDKDMLEFSLMKKLFSACEKKLFLDYLEDYVKCDALKLIKVLLERNVCGEFYYGMWIDLFKQLCKVCMSFDENVREIAFKVLAIFREDCNIPNVLLLQTLSKISLFQTTEQLRKENLRLQFEKADFANSFDDDFKNNEYCGIFIHGLEDEYISVRKAVVAAIENFSMISQAFAESSADFLFDVVINDFEEVQTLAISALMKSVGKFQRASILVEEQIESLLRLLFSSSENLRSFIYELLVNLNLSENLVFVIVQQTFEFISSHSSASQLNSIIFLKYMVQRNKKLIKPLIHRIMDLSERKMDVSQVDAENALDIALVCILYHSIEDMKDRETYIYDFSSKIEAYRRIVPELF
jgi:hypothetical protein